MQPVLPCVAYAPAVCTNHVALYSLVMRQNNDAVADTANQTNLTTDCLTDIVFVLDRSGSIGSANFNLTKSFLSRLVSGLDVDGGSTRVGIVAFSTNVSLIFNLGSYSTVADVQAAISAINYTTGGTNTARALAYVRTTMLTSEAGDRSNASNVVLVLTDGQSDSAYNTRVSV